MHMCFWVWQKSWNLIIITKHSGENNDVDKNEQIDKWWIDRYMMDRQIHNGQIDT